MMWREIIEEKTARIRREGKERFFTQTRDATETELMWQGRRLLNLASNNYLHLAGDPRLIKAQQQAATIYGAGATASRLIAGNYELYGQAEQMLCNWKQKEAGLLINSGYTLNIGLFQALCNRHTLVFSDQYNHASMIDGVVLSRAQLKRYKHVDMTDLERQLQKADPDKLKIIATESVFSMDGDVAPLTQLIDLKKRYNALLIVDEAHATGVFGPLGQGLVAAQNLTKDVDIQIGTCSKALGSFGAYLVGDAWLVNYLKQTMRSLIFTTALPPAVLGSIIQSIEIVQTADERRLALSEKAAHFRESIQEAGFHTYRSTTQIVPVHIGSNQAAVQFAKHLQANGVAAIPIRPPTVPENQARIRFAVTVAHTHEMLDEAAHIIQRSHERLGAVR